MNSWSRTPEDRARFERRLALSRRTRTLGLAETCPRDTAGMDEFEAILDREEERQKAESDKQREAALRPGYEALLREILSGESPRKSRRART